MIYQVFSNNAIIQITKTQFKEIEESDEQLYQRAFIHLSDGGKSLTIIPAKNIRFSQGTTDFYPNIDFKMEQEQVLKHIKIQAELELLSKDFLLNECTPKH